MSHTAVLLASTLHEPPAPACDYFRDGAKPPFTRDFAFLGALLACWPDGRPEVLFFSDRRQEQAALRFETDDGVLCLPLSGKPAEPGSGLSAQRVISYEELEHCFVTRFFQYRLIHERQERVGEGFAADGLLTAGAEELTTHVQLNHELCGELKAALRFQPLVSRPPGASTRPQAYCPLDGWIAPLYRSLGASDAPLVHYLLCPECLGNINFEAGEG